VVREGQGQELNNSTRVSSSLPQCEERQPNSLSAHVLSLAAASPLLLTNQERERLALVDGSCWVYGDVFSIDEELGVPLNI